MMSFYDMLMFTTVLKHESSILMFPTVQKKIKMYGISSATLADAKAKNLFI
jgi:hypothetical protein